MNKWLKNTSVRIIDASLIQKGLNNGDTKYQITSLLSNSGEAE